MDSVILDAQHLHYTYPDGTHALKDISIKIRKGRKIAVLGSNGSGKSTLFLNLNGILRPQKGKLVFKGKDVEYSHPGLTELRKSVGIVFQDPDTQLFSASVYQEVSFGAMNLKLTENVVRRRVDAALRGTDTFHLKDKATHFLSYGEKKRVSIADILVMEPEIIIFDEPAACLDPYNTLQIMGLFNGLNKNGTTLIMSTHDVEVAWSWAEEVFILKDGGVEGSGSPEKVFADEKLLGNTGLEKPFLLATYEKLKACGVIDASSLPPKNKEQLFTMIETSVRLLRLQTPCVTARGAVAGAGTAP
jgi:cobalt/nickel transport system ATP-binding protein